VGWRDPRSRISSYSKRIRLASCPQPAEADISHKKADSGFDPYSDITGRFLLPRTGSGLQRPFAVQFSTARWFTPQCDDDDRIRRSDLSAPLLR
jgi:hypothetical protein